MSASLNGTMSGMSVMSPEEQAILAQMNAVAQQQQQLLSQSTQAATQQAGQAQQQYSQAAQAPPPDLAALQLLSTLGGGLSEIMGNQGAAERQQQNVQQSRAAMLQARAQNLQSLRDVYSQKADEAQRAGDLETTEKYRRQFETLSKQLDVVEGNHKRAQAVEEKEADRQARLDLEKIQHGYRLGEIAASGAESRKTKAAADQVALGEAFDAELKTTPGGKTYLPLTNIKGVKATTAARRWASQNGYPMISPQMDATIDRLHIAKQNNQDMIATLRTFAPKDWKDVGTMAGNKAAELTGADPQIATYKNYFDALIQQLVALAGGQGSGLRINQAEITRQIKIAPNVATPLPVAEAWAARTQRLIDNAEQPMLGRAKGGAPAVAAPSSTKTAKVKMRGTDNKLYNVDSSERAEAEKNGWQVVP